MQKYSIVFNLGRRDTGWGEAGIRRVMHMAAAILGWMGTAGTLLAYVLVSRGRIASGSRRYAALNIIGGSLKPGRSA